MIRLFVMALLWLMPVQGHTQDAAILVADSIYVDGTSRLVAEGRVEVYQDGTRLTANRIVYDQTAGSIALEGPIRITDASGQLVLADQGTIDTDLQNALLKGARVVLNEQLQLAARDARRIDGRYTELRKVAVTSCHVCSDEVPLWQIRASRVIHDQTEQQLYFDNAQLRFMDVPIFYLPRLRLPDPTLKRARGFLIPVIKTNTLLGFGVKVPYFIPIGPHQDLTLTPYLSTETRTLEARYRRAFRYGNLEVNSALAFDELTNHSSRGYIFAQGHFDLARDYSLTFDIEATTDAAFLSDYRYSDKDRLDSAIGISRVKPYEYTSAEVIHFESLRDGEDNATLPTIVLETVYEKRLMPRFLGGEFRLGVGAHSHFRYSDTDIAGRDVSSLNAQASWRRRWTLPAGVRLGLTGQIWADSFRVSQDSTSAATVSRVTPAAAIELRWPLVRRSGMGGHHLIEPVAQIGWTGGVRPNLPNEESSRVEFDEANLLSLSRFPEDDARERGLVQAAGFRWIWHMNDGGWRTALTVGRVWRDMADNRFTLSSGLDGTASDWLIATGFSTGTGLDLMARGLLSTNDGFSKAEARATWSNETIDLAASYVLLLADPAENRPSKQSEWSFDGSYQLAKNWTGSANWRYDLADDRLARAGLGLDYSNECIDVGFSVSRRFATSTNLEPSTDFGLTVLLKGFSTGGSAKHEARSCGR
ncbi:MAG: LPS assembly protein LptD [Rhodobacteraceae bacterium]|nr:LPS assembly protein LptD [Paracoccaceae bacterium]